MADDPVRTADEGQLHGARVRALLYRRDAALARHRAALARSLGLTDGEMIALVHVAHRDNLNTAMLASLLDLSSGGATAMVQRLERAGLVRRRPHPTDRRSFLLELTESAAGRIAVSESALHEGVERATSSMPAQERAVIARFLVQLAELSEGLTRADLGDGSSARPVPRPLVPSLWG